MLDLYADLRRASHSLRRSPGFAAAAIATLALGAGANTAIFSVVNGVLLRPLPYDRPEELVRLRLEGGRFSIPFTPRELVALQDGVDGVRATAGYRFQNDAVVTDAERSWLLGSASVTADLFPMLGVRPALGRGFTRQDSSPGAETVAMISHRFWQSAFAADPSVIGRRLGVADSRYSSGAHTIIGVLPPGVGFPDNTIDIWVALPIDSTNAETFEARNENVRILARIADSAGLEAVAERVSGLVRGLNGVPAEREFPYVRLERHQEARVEDYRRRLLILTAVVAAVLLVAVVNVANLSITRLETRRAELTIRAALGAGRGRLATLVLGEALLVGVAGAVVGYLLARASVGALLAALPAEIEEVATIDLDWRVFAFALVVSTISALAAALVPSLRTGRLALARGIRRSSGGAAAATGMAARRPLVAVQIALVVPLVAATGLLAKSLWRLQAEDPGVRSERVVSLRVDARHPDMPALNEYFESVLDRLRAVPGIESAGIVRSLPFTGGSSISSVTFVDHPTMPRDEDVLVDYQVVHSGFFETLGIPVLAGRDLSASDTRGAPWAVVVNQEFVDTYYPHASALGERIISGETWEIVGVVGDIRRRGLGEPARPEMYVPYGQVFNARGTRRIVMRFASGRPPTLDRIRDEILAVDPAVAITEVESMQDVLAASVAVERGTMQLMALFALLALAMATVGISGTIAYLVVRRTPELGIRMALGARGQDALGIVMRDGVVLLVAGLTLGAGAALGLGRAIASMLYEVEPFDPLTLAITAIVITATVLGAVLIPGMRATRVDPVAMLRSE